MPREGIGFGLLRHLAPEAAAMLAGLPRPALFNYLGQFDRLLPGGAEAAGWALAGEAAGAAVADARGRGHLLEANAVVAGGMLQVEWRWCGAVHEAASVAGLAEQFLAGLRGLIAHCLTPGVGGHTPSDFPLAGVDQATLEAIERQHPELEDLYPLTPLQEGLLFHGLYDRAGDPYHIQLTLDLAGEVEAAALRAAWQLILDRHAALRTVVQHGRSARPLQLVRGSVELPWTELDWSDLDEAAFALRLENLLADDRAQGFDFTAGPLLRVALLHRADRRCTLATSHHHLILDGWSQGRVIGELLQAYAVLRQGGTPELPPVPPPSAYAAWLAKQDRGAAEAFWRSHLAGLDGPVPPGGAGPRHRHPAAPAGMGEHALTLPAELSRRLQAFARRHRLTLNTLLQGAWAILLARYTGRTRRGLRRHRRGQARRPPRRGADGRAVHQHPAGAGPGRRDRPISSAGSPSCRRAQAEAQAHATSRSPRSSAGPPHPRGEALFDTLTVHENYPLDAALQDGSALAAAGFASPAPTRRADQLPPGLDDAARRWS